jgi:hypothetical protein
MPKHQNKPYDHGARRARHQAQTVFVEEDQPSDVSLPVKLANG